MSRHRLASIKRNVADCRYATRAATARLVGSPRSSHTNPCSMSASACSMIRTRSTAMTPASHRKRHDGGGQHQHRDRLRSRNRSQQQTAGNQAQHPEGHDLPHCCQLDRNCRPQSRSCPRSRTHETKPSPISPKDPVCAKINSRYRTRSISQTPCLARSPRRSSQRLSASQWGKQPKLLRAPSTGRGIDRCHLPHGRNWAIQISSPERPKLRLSDAYPNRITG